MWYFLAIWVLIIKEYQVIKQIMCCFFWGKFWEEGSRGARVVWDKVVQVKEDGGLGVIDFMVKAKVLQAQWLFCSLVSGISFGSFG